MDLKIEKVDSNAKLPTKGSRGAAGFDLYAHLGEHKELAIYPETAPMIGTGLKMKIPTGYFGALFARSGLATKRKLRPANCVGVIDSDYTGEVKVALYNDSSEIQRIKDGERIAQMVFIPCFDASIIPVDKLEDTERGNGGFGSTGD